MIDFESDTVKYAAAFFITVVPSFVFVKFVGDQADNSRGALSEQTKEKFKRAVQYLDYLMIISSIWNLTILQMMEQPGANFALPTSEEEALKKQVAKAYMQDKDVDVAVLEEKLRKRAQWRKEMMAQAKNSAAAAEDEDGW